MLPPYGSFCLGNWSTLPLRSDFLAFQKKFEQPRLWRIARVEAFVGLNEVIEPLNATNAIRFRTG